MEDRMEDRIKDVMAAVFEISVDEIKVGSSPHSVKLWDSMNHMKLVVALEEEFDIRFEDDEIPSLVSFNIIVATIISYKECD